MTQQYYSIITNAGLLKNAAANAPGGSLVNLTHLAVGDASYNPAGTATALQNERYRTTLTNVVIDADNPNQLVVEAVINETVGPFYIREVGIFDEDGDLFAIGKYPETFKPDLPDGSGKRLYIRMILGFASSPNVELIISDDINNDPNFSENVFAALAEKLVKEDNLADLEDKKEARANLGLGFFSNKNALINGDFNIWQRGTSFASAANGTYTADRWAYFKNGAMVHDVSRSTDLPTLVQAGRLFNYSLLADCTTVDSSVTGIEFCVIEHRIEGYNWLPFAQKALTLSFWVKATKTGIYCAYLKTAPGDKAFIGEYTVNQSDTWEFKTINIPASPSSGTWDYTNGIGVEVGFSLAVGPTLQTPAGVWQSNGALGSPNQVNACDNTANNFRICGVQLELGSVATSFEHRSFQHELLLCQRYYRRNNPGVPAISINSTTLAVHDTFEHAMRTNPSLSLISGVNPAWEEPGVLNRTGSGSAIVSSGVGANGFFFGMNGFATMNGQRPGYMTNIFAQFDAEL